MELLLIVAALLVLRWLWHAWFHPMAPCGRCGGSGRNPGSTGKRWGPCRRCKGSGSRQVRGSKQLHRAVRGLRSARSDRKD